jgi:hypothetical protein
MEIVFWYRHLFSHIHVDMNISVVLSVGLFQITEILSKQWLLSSNVSTYNISSVCGVHIAGQQAIRTVTEKDDSNLKTDSLFKQYSWRQ